MTKKGMIVAGVMSGTSADGINVALVRMNERLGSRKLTHSHPSFQLLGHAEFSYPKKVRAAVLAAMNASRASVADLSRLNFLLGELYSDAVLATERQFRVKADLVGCHGQTLYHQGESQRFLGRRIAATWQTGEAAIVSARVGAPVVSDFRPADLATGGKGAPLVPFLDYWLFRDAQTGRIVQNIGGIANLTMITAGATADDVVAFDTGPGNMVIDAVTEKLFGLPFDRGGRIAASGKVLAPVIHELLRRGFFRRSPPKTAGREEFGREFVRDFLRSCKRCRTQDVVATATALTAKSIADAVQRYAAQKSGSSHKPGFEEMILSGGGAKNSTLVTMLTNDLAPLGLRLRFSDEFGLPSAAKEAVAFAVLAHETWQGRPSSLPSATGAKRAAILGKISYP
ncbi:MAG TPA: anhydro-N-acetylmuramic acid kinase [Terriglobales bacterium]|nr:anhydro-N-acetylmuramic acid kinase [Terriglobales bacterium]